MYLIFYSYLIYLAIIRSIAAKIENKISFNAYENVILLNGSGNKTLYKEIISSKNPFK